MTAATRPRYRFRSEHAGLTLIGRGWRAQFVDGRFETDDRLTAAGIVRQAVRFPEYEVRPIRGSDDPTEGEPATPPTEPEGG